MIENRKSTGAKAEQLARIELETRGLSLIHSNFSCRFGEIDLIMRDRDVVVFVEVRFRKSSKFGTPVETVDRRKQRKLILAAQWFLQNKRWTNRSARFDVIGVSPSENAGKMQYQWCKNAFSA